MIPAGVKWGAYWGTPAVNVLACSSWANRTVTKRWSRFRGHPRYCGLAVSVSRNRERILVVGPFEQHFRRSRSVGGLGVDVPIASTIRAENDPRAITAPQRTKIAGARR